MRKHLWRPSESLIPFITFDNSSYWSPVIESVKISRESVFGIVLSTAFVFSLLWTISAGASVLPQRQLWLPDHDGVYRAQPGLPSYQYQQWPFANAREGLAHIWLTCCTLYSTKVTVCIRTMHYTYTNPVVSSYAFSFYFGSLLPVSIIYQLDIILIFVCHILLVNGGLDRRVRGLALWGVGDRSLVGFPHKREGFCDLWMGK